MHTTDLAESARKIAATLTKQLVTVKRNSSACLAWRMGLRVGPDQQFCQQHRQHCRQRCCLLSQCLAIGMIAVTCSLLLAPPAIGQEQAEAFEVPADVEAITSQLCLDCHQEGAAEADVSLDSWQALPHDDRLELLNRIQEQLYFQRMPPAEATAIQEEERERLLDWVSGELQLFGASKLEEKLQRPEFGNYLDHESLFSGEYAELPGFTYDRRWLISEFIFDARMNRLLNHRPTQTIDGVRQSVIGDNNRRVNLTNPFLLPKRSGVRYYANETLNAGHLLTMMTNAKEVAEHMVALTHRDRRYAPAIAEIQSLQWEQERTLAARESFLNNFIEPVLLDLYGEEHQRLLPAFVSVGIPSASSAEADQASKAPFHAANPGNQELVLIFRSMRRLEEDGDTDEALILKCEREWFFHGHDPRQIQARVTFLHNYMAEWRQNIIQHRYDEKHRRLEYQPAANDEMQIINEAILRHRQAGDHYDQIIGKCLSEWRDAFGREQLEQGGMSSEELQGLVAELFVKILERTPSSEEAEQFVALGHAYDSSMDRQGTIEQLIQTLILRSDFSYRQEFGQGPADTDGRRMMSPHDASYAIAYALTDSSPDPELVDAVNNGRLTTVADYEREVRRLLNRRDQYYVIDEAVQRIQLTASITNTPIRKLRFFREFFGYPQMLDIFKDNKRFGGNYDNAKGRLVGEADRLVDHILQGDQQVIEALLSTEDFYVFHSGDNEAMTASSDRIRRIYDYFKEYDWENFEQEDLLEHREFLAEVKMRGVDVDNLMSAGRRNSIREFKTALTSFRLRFENGQTAAAPYVSFPAHGPYNASTRTGLQLRSPEVAKFFNIQLDDWNYPAVQPAPVEHRRGMLTHPAWLIAHAQNTETDPVRRGRWVREKLLAGTVPDLPITVDAVIPEDHHQTLRQRLDAKTEQEYCWQCHQQMNPLGVTFEIFDDFGRFRREESLEHPENLLETGPDKAPVHVDLRDIYRTLPVDARGYLAGTGDDRLDGEVQNALELMERLAQSNRVRQSVIRHAFRYFMGRNEMLSDSRTLIEAERAYLDSGGSFDELIVSLLTSDSFVYRKPNP